MEQTLRGRAYVLGDDIDTDQIIPAQYLVYSLEDPEERLNYGRFALSSVPPGQRGLPAGDIPFVREGEHLSDYAIIVGGKNFGCGSSREHAPVALNIAGVKAVVAESYARIFFRNSVDGGYLYPIEASAKLNDMIKTGDEVEIDIAASQLINHSSGERFALNPLGDAAGIVEAGGIFAYARKHGLTGT
ncbi:MAG: 3-isopropylmalate dehydratase [Alphaproteobacteria bacterium CG_4_10_14_0_2_um_filter_63_37]|nr:MAG: 3-isopropylmalate dehydratase [Proteobacteria bacterium CG1_02_64_396]PJA24265.1 MAG: 3-isopropylmalate dehydratase [Alphaproteobacteria bacterium CG_4_10_14_0_2_um_filter_63_37]